MHCLTCKSNLGNCVCYVGKTQSVNLLLHNEFSIATQQRLNILNPNYKIISKLGKPGPNLSLVPDPKIDATNPANCLAIPLHTVQMYFICFDQGAASYSGFPLQMFINCGICFHLRQNIRSLLHSCSRLVRVT